MKLKTVSIALACAGILGLGLSAGVLMSKQASAQKPKFKVYFYCGPGFKRAGSTTNYLCYRNVVRRCRTGMLASAVAVRQLSASTWRIEYRCIKKPS